MPAKPNSSNPTNRAWQRMLSGRRLDILSPSPLDIEIEDIAHGLARVTRWNGQTNGTYGLSVAQHSLLVEGILSRNAPQLAQKWRLAGLMHDAPEYVIGD
ncbi:MAG: hydrolase, partial [Pseudomonadota bacterium]|nr:hydrolase [Pseudomonadota bacterium]